ncbi:hypothetical protein ACMXYR_05510 [Neptuniibacter sp. QD29_5]|uniref:hypothetical protein n=1 Tax=unclassified Neptuniibacter TaxID=2630693 RepID=UPI0039F5FBF0
MPLPLLLGAAAVLAGGYGVKKGLDAKADYNEAEAVNSEAEDIYDNAEAKLQKARAKAEKSINELGKTKFCIYKETLLPFVDAFSKIKNIDFDDSGLLETSNLTTVTSDDMQTVEVSAMTMKDVVGGGIAALGSGGLAGLATYGGVGLLGTASTGTAISSLGGVAATNATLAWLGGGSLAAGGMGMAGGMAVLGGIVAGPVLAAGGMMAASKAEAAKEDAYSNLYEAELAAEKMKSAKVVTKGINRRFKEINEVLVELNLRFIPMLQSLQDLVGSDIDYTNYSSADKKGVFITAALAKTLKNVMEAPLLDEDGLVTSESRSALKSARKALEA